MSKSIALFGGSFNPPHAGHYAIARRLARRKTIDEVWILPVYRHVFGKKMTPFEERLRSARKFFRALAPKVRVKDIERRLGGTSYTIRLIRFLKKKHPGWRFLLVIGEDNYRLRRRWRGFDAIQKEAALIVISRGKKSPIPDVSSTELRKKLKKDLAGP